MKTRAELLKAAQSIINQAKGADRDLTRGEQATVEGYFQQIDAIDARAKSAEAREADAIMKRMEAMGASGGGAVQFDAADVKDGLTSAIRSKGSFGFNMPFTKAALTTSGLDLPGNGSTVSDVPLGTAVVALRELLQVEKVDVGHVRYYTMGAGAADVVAEGAKKPDLGATITPEDAALQKIAATFTFTDELAQDAGFLVDHIQHEALRSVLVRENALIVSAFDSAVGTLTSSGPAADALDVIAGAIGAAEASNGLSPAMVILNPLDLAAIRTAKASTGGSYHVDPLAAGPSTVHGVPLAATPAVASGTAYLVSGGAGVFYAHTSDLRVETGYTGDDWIYNRVTTRVEERVLPAVVRPSLLTQITFTAS